jgi:hypothetical protein
MADCRDLRPDPALRKTTMTNDRHNASPVRLSLMAALRAQINAWDILAAILFAAASVAYFYLRWQGATPFVFLNSDAANISCFAAGRDHPGLFARDALLGNPDNFYYYSTIHIPLLRALVHVFGDYGTAFLAMLAPHVFVQLLGFYVLGRIVFKDRFWALLLVLITLRPIPTGIGADFWGIYGDAIPRITFQAVFPWILAAAWRWRERPKSWPWILVAAGLLMYAHPVSAPALGFSLWLGFWFFMPRTWRMPRRLGYMLFLGLVFLAATYPFTRNYVSNHSYGSSFDYDTIFKIMRFRFNTIFMDVPYAIGNSARRLVESMLLPLATVSGILLWRANGRTRQGVILCTAWIAGYLFVSMPLPLAEHTICRALKIIPLEIDLIRNVRFIYPIGLMMCLWGMLEIRRTHPAPNVRRAALAAAIIGVMGWSVINRPPWLVDKPAQIIRPLAPRPAHPHARDMIGALTFIRDHTPPGSAFVPTSHVNPLAIRYFALRPVLLCAKDGGPFAYVNHEMLVEWYENFKVMQRVDETQNPQMRLRGYATLARDLDADYLFMDYGKDLVISLAPELSTQIAYGNASYSIIKM